MSASTGLKEKQRMWGKERSTRTASPPSLQLSFQLATLSEIEKKKQPIGLELGCDIMHPATIAGIACRRHTHTHTYITKNTYTYTHKHTHIHIHTYISIYAYINVCIKKNMGSYLHNDKIRNDLEKRHFNQKTK